MYTSLKTAREHELDKLANRLLSAKGKLVSQVTIDEPEDRQRVVFLNTILLLCEVFKMKSSLGLEPKVFKLKTSLALVHSTASNEQHSEDGSGYDSTRHTPPEQAAAHEIKNVELDDFTSSV